MIKPKKLQPGDKVAAISLSWGGPGTFPHRYEAGKQQLQNEFDLQIIEMPHALKDADWLRKNPQARADDLMQSFDDPTIKAIISTIGGDDSIRLLPFVDLNIIRDNPKIYLGYSDATTTHLLCHKAGLVSFYGPTIMTEFAENCGIFPYVSEHIQRMLFSSTPIGVIEPCKDGWTVEMIDWSKPENQAHKRTLTPSTGWKYLEGKGIHSGHLIGGCLDVLEFLRGTDFWPDPSTWENAILFLETSEDAPPPIAVKYALRTYASMGILKNLSGILFGRPGGNVSPERFYEYDDVFRLVVTEEEGLPDVPIITRMDFGHTSPMFTLPYGVQAQIDCDKEQFTILESAVRD